MAKAQRMDAERARLRQDARRARNWKRWGPYLAEREWGTVREDYSADGDPWKHFTHEDARSRAYRWGEDGLLGFTDRECRLCFAVALWNERDALLKERLFGLTGDEGNHGEDVKEEYFYLDATPTSSYAKALYKYPQAAFPYDRLRAENARRGYDDGEFELVDTGVFDEERYFDVVAEVAKAGPNDMLIRITAANRGPEAAPLHLLPTLWFRNTWSWGCKHEGCTVKPNLRRTDDGEITSYHPTLGVFRFAADTKRNGDGLFLFTENETNTDRLYGHANASRYVKDAFHDVVVHGDGDAVNPEEYGTKSALHYGVEIPAGEEVVLRFRLYAEEEAPKKVFGRGFDTTFARRITEADTFYETLTDGHLSEDRKTTARQAYAGLLWSKQFYHYVVEDWLDGDPDMPPPPPKRRQGRNADWGHVFHRNVISMPDTWEYPWFAAWDLAFHMLPFARLDPEFAKKQLNLFLREWTMHPNGQIPAYEWDFSDVNPPVHAWACWRAYKIAAPRGKRDRRFLASVFQKLLINFTWWVNRKDAAGRHIFSGGFLGMDNIGVFDRSQAVPAGGSLDQADATAWMAFYCVTMLSISLELAQDDPAYEDIASKFFEHFVAIADAMNTLGGTGLWDEEDGFYYDQLLLDGRATPLRIWSLVGLIPLIAVTVLHDGALARLPGFRKRMDWFLANRKDLAQVTSYLESRAAGDEPGMHRLLAIPSRERLERVLSKLLDEDEFLSPYGIRSVSRYHADHPYCLWFEEAKGCVEYVPGESNSGLFGGNSNWRGPIWFPINYLLIEGMERYGHYYGESLKVECPTGSGNLMTLSEVACELNRRMADLFLPDADGQRPCFGDDARFASAPHWRELRLFHEYFHGDTGRGLGATHQTGWTALITRILEALPASEGGP